MPSSDCASTLLVSSASTSCSGARAAMRSSTTFSQASASSARLRSVMSTPTTP
jgi:hypothetical protein